MSNTPHNLQYLCLSSIQTLPMKKQRTTDILTVSMPLSSPISLFTFFKNPFFFVKNQKQADRRRPGQRQGYKGPKPLSNLIFCSHPKKKSKEKLFMKLSMLIFLCLLSFRFQHSHSTTILVDGVSEWKNPTVHVGDSIIFKHKYQHNLYIFQNQRAFNLCNFTQATILKKPDSTSYTWHPSRPGFFYFAFNNGSLLKACQDTQKLAIRVSSSSSAAAAPGSSSSTTSSPQLPPVASPTPSSGGAVSSSPAYPWPFHPRQVSFSPSPQPSISSSVAVPDKGGGGGMPFINSNPAVPLPTGEVDSATIRPLPTSGHQGQVFVGLFALQMEMALFCVVFLML